MRCWEMEKAGVHWLAGLGDGLRDWVEDVIASTHGTPHQGRLTPSLEHRVVTLGRLMWQSIMNNSDHLNKKLERSNKTKLYLHRIRELVQDNWEKFGGIGRYTPQ